MAASKSELENQLKEKTMRLSELESHVSSSKRDRVSSEEENRRSDDDVAVFKVGFDFI